MPCPAKLENCHVSPIDPVRRESVTSEGSTSLDISGHSGYIRACADCRILQDAIPSHWRSGESDQGA